MNFSNNFIKKILYRPFDIRYIYYDSNILGRSRESTLFPMLCPNYGLIVMRQVYQNFEVYNHFNITRYLIDERTFYSNRGGTYIYPLFIYEKRLNEISKSNIQMEFDKENPEININRQFIKAIENKLSINYRDSISDLQSNQFNSFDILSYIYSILSSEAYRKRYKEFLKKDFPRIPITNNLTQFRQLCILGKNLISTNLLESLIVKEFITTYPETGENRIEKGFPKYSLEKGEGRVFINSNQYFSGVPETIWSMNIGGYQVLAKWLKDRRGRQLTYDDLTHYQKVVVALSETIRITKEIDKAIPEWPIK